MSWRILGRIEEALETPLPGKLWRDGVQRRIDISRLYCALILEDKGALEEILLRGSRND